MEREVKKMQSLIAEKVAGKWIPEHDEFGHHYRQVIDASTSVHVKKNMEGVLQDSVTTKLGILNKPHLMRWAVRIGIEFLEKEERWSRLNSPDREDLLGGAMSAHTDIRDVAGSVGTQAHDIFENYVNEWIDKNKRPENVMSFVLPGTDPRAISCARGLEQLFIKKNVIPVATELLVGNAKYSSGTLDLLCYWDGKLTLVDYKSSNQIDKINYPLQVAAYMYFFKHMLGRQCPSFTHAKIILLSKDSPKFEVWKINKLADAFDAFKAICKTYDWMRNGKVKVEKDIKKIIL